MSPARILDAIELYRERFRDLGIGKTEYPHAELLDTSMHGLEHCHGMLDRMTEFVAEGRIEKAFRWLGFIQGVLWAGRVYPLADLKDHNRPPGGA